MRAAFCLELALVTTNVCFAAARDRVLPWGPTTVMTAAYVNREIDELDVACDEAWTALGSRAEYDAYRKSLKAKMLSAIGTFPERTPLNARTVATVQRDGYRIEKVIFESMPGLFVTANLFVPDGEGKRPAVVMSCGHSTDWSKDAPGYLRACVLAAKEGFVALMFDPHSQGERRWERTRSVGNHNQLGYRAALIDWSMPLLRIWDGMRAIDYVVTRPEVDAVRLGYMGQSGGGTMTALMMAADDRIRVAAPSCFLTSLRRLCDFMGPQDGEQNIYGQLSFGLNHTGYVLIPDIPVAVTCKFGDAFPYSGVKTLMRTVRSVERAAGLGERTLLNCYPGPHGWTEANRVASVRFLAKYLMPEHASDTVDPASFWPLDVGFDLKKADIGLPDEAERGCCKDRTTENLPGSRSILDIIGDRAQAGRAKWRKGDAAATAETVCRVAKIRMPAEVGRIVKNAATNVVDGRPATGVVVLDPKTGHMLPAQFFAGAAADRTPVLVCAWKGRARGRELAKAYLGEGRSVMVADVSGVGEVGQEKHVFYRMADRPDEGLGAMCFLIGEPLVGRRATDMLVFAEALAARCGGRKPLLVAEGPLAIPAAHAYAADRSAWAGVELLERPASWTEIFEAGSSDRTLCHYADIVPRAYLEYDWIDLVK